MRCPPILAAAVIALAAHPVTASVLCVGVEPRFGMVLDGHSALFDYFGDGTFGLEPRLPQAFQERFEADLVTGAARVPLTIQPQTCAVAGITQPLTIEILIPSNGGQTLFRGCCRDRRPQDVLG